MPLRLLNFLPLVGCAWADITIEITLEAGTLVNGDGDALQTVGTKGTISQSGPITDALTYTAGSPASGQPTSAELSLEGCVSALETANAVQPASDTAQPVGTYEAEKRQLSEIKVLTQLADGGLAPADGGSTFHIKSECDAACGIWMPRTDGDVTNDRHLANVARIPDVGAKCFMVDESAEDQSSSATLTVATAKWKISAVKGHTRNGDETSYTGGYQLVFDVTAAAVDFGTATTDAGETYGVSTTASSLCQSLTKLDVGAAFGGTSAKPRVMQCFADAADGTATTVTMSFLTNYDRMEFAWLLKALAVNDSGNLTYDGSADYDGATAQTAVKNDDAASENFTAISSFAAATIKGDNGAASETFGSSMTMKCVSAADPTWTAEKEFKNDVYKAMVAAEALPTPTTMTWAYATTSFTADFWSDEDLFKLARYLYTTPGDGCLQWKVTAFTCSKCSSDGLTGVTDGLLEYAVTLKKSAGFADADAVCTFADDFDSNDRITYCKASSANVTSGSKSEGATLGFVNADNARDVLRAIAGAAGVDAGSTPAGSDFNALDTSDLYKLQYAITVADSPSVTIVANAGTVGANATANSACKAWVDSTDTNCVYCVSNAAGTTVELYYVDPAARLSGARQLRDRTTADFKFGIPTAASGSVSTWGASSLRTALFTSTGVASDEKAAWTNASHDATASPAVATADTGCAAATAITTKEIYCSSGKAIDSAMTLIWIGDGTSDANAVADMRLLTVTRDPLGAAGSEFGQFKLQASGDGSQADLYSVTYDITSVATAGDVAATTALANLDGFQLAGSACEFYKSTAVNAVYCAGSSSSMTMGWLYSATRATEAKAIGRVALGATRVKSVKPTGFGQPSAATATAIADVTYTFTTANGADATAQAWTAAAEGSMDTASSACAFIQATVADAIYCDSLKAKNSEMTLIWLDTATAKANIRSLYVVDALGTAATASAASTLIAVALPTADQFHTATYTVNKYVSDAPGPAPAALATGYISDPQDRGDGCEFAMPTATRSTWCTQTTADEIVMSWATKDDRVADAHLLAEQAGATAPVGSVTIDSAKDKAETTAMVSIAWKATARATTGDTPSSDWTAAANGILGASGSACGAAFATTTAVYCDSQKTAGSAMTLKFFSESYASVADATVMELSYLATARSVANLSYDAGVQAFDLDDASTTPEVLVINYTASTTTTTNAARQLTAVGSAVSTGSFATDSSWCNTLAATAKSAIFCASGTDNTMTLSYLDLALAVADVKSLEALPDYAVAMQVPTSQRIIVVFAVNTDLVANALCSAIESGGVDYASCKHAALVVGSRRRLSTADVTVTLGFATPATYAAGALAAQALVADPSALEAAGVTAVSSVTDGSGSPVGTPAPSPTSDSDDTDDSDGTSTATLRVVSLLGLVGFVLA